MTNGEKYKTNKTRKNKYSDFCFDSLARPCENCTAYEQGKNCFDVWLSLDCKCGTELPERTVALIEREKRVQYVALQLVARTSANVAYAFKLEEEYVCECERRDNPAVSGCSQSALRLGYPVIIERRV